MPIASFRMVEAAKLKLEDSELEDRFLSGAPDAGYREYREGVSNFEEEEEETKKKEKKVRKLRGRKAVITLNIDPKLLDEFDELCEDLDQTRSQMLTMLIKKAVDRVIM